MRRDSGSSEFVVGAKKNSDGSWDTTKAMTWEPSETVLADANALLERERKNAQKELEIPAWVKPGSSDMVSYRLRNAVILNERKIKAEENPYSKQAVAARDRVKMFQLEKRLFGHPSLFEAIRQKQEENPDSPADGLSASDMYDILQKEFVDKWESEVMKGTSLEEYVSIGEDSMDVGVLKDLLSAGKDLQRLLLDEASRENSQQ